MLRVLLPQLGKHPLGFLTWQAMGEGACRPIVSPVVDAVGEHMLEPPNWCS